MNKIMMRLVAVALSLALAVTLVLMTTYAWLTLSTSTAVSGIQMTIGDNTILVAPNVSETVDGVTYNYPGEFSDTLNFSDSRYYGYLSELGGLLPVSTADGVNWFLPSDAGAAAVQEVTLSDNVVGNFQLETDLAHANLPAAKMDKDTSGHYVYLDFWVVAPIGNYTLRVSTGNDSTGSFLMDLPEAVQVENDWVLKSPAGGISTIARVGFLVDQETAANHNNMLRYTQSKYYNTDYTALRGAFVDPSQSSFTIYEPNADDHPSNPEIAGDYVATKPLGVTEDGVAGAVSVQDITTVQKHSVWAQSQSGIWETRISQAFDAYKEKQNFADMSAQEITADFYNNPQTLDGHISSYITKGGFIKNSTELVEHTPKDILDTLGTGGASKDVSIVQLQRNIPQRIRMFIWLEGQDVDYTSKAAVSQFVLNLELAGGNR